MEVIIRLNTPHFKTFVEQTKRTTKTKYMQIKKISTKMMMALSLLAAPALASAQTITAIDDAATVAAGNTVNINVLNNDTYTGSALINDYSALSPSIGTLVKNADNTFSYAAPAGYNGTITFTYTIRQCNVLATPIGHTYQFVSAPGISWEDAKAAADTMEDALGRQGYLATITSEAENVAAYAATQYLLPNGLPYGHPSWLGGSDAVEEGVWRWMTGPEAGQQFSGQDLTFTTFINGFLPQLPCAFHKWGQQEPNQNQNKEEDYLHLQGQNFWNDMTGEVNAGDMDGYLVEFGGMDSGDPELTSTATVTITVTNTNGGETCVTPVVKVTPSSCTYTGGVATNIYLGYGPQSATVKVTPAAGYTYSWSLNGTVVSTNSSTVFAPTTEGSYIYTLTATNASTGCVKTAAVAFCVKDIRVPSNNYSGGCGGYGNSTPKVYICYKSKCSGSYHTYAVKKSKVACYISKNSSGKLGSCNQTCGGSARMAEESVIDIADDYAVNTYPVPNNGAFTVEIPFSPEETNIMIMDMNGKLIANKSVKEEDGTKINFSLSNIAPGVYFIKVNSGEESAMSKMIIQ